MEKRAIDGVDIAYRVSGEPGGKPIVLMHGATANMRDWFLTVKPLAAAGWRVLTPDMPGHGGSSAPDDIAVYAMTAVADRLHALAAGLGFAPAVIVGHSMGGAVAEEYAIRHGGDVAALVLVDSAGGAPRDFPRTPEFEAFLAEEKQLAYGPGGMEALWEMHQARGAWSSVKGLPPPVQAFFKARFCSCSANGYFLGGVALAARRDTVPELSRIGQRTLVTLGEREEPFLTQVSESLAAAIPNARLVKIPGAGHSPQFENADAFNAVLLEFLGGL